MTGILLCDVSRHQGLIDWAAYAQAAGMPAGYGAGLLRAKAAICKATGADHDSGGTTWVDTQFTRNRDAMRRLLDVRGFYHFLQINADPVAQARHFARTIGELLPGEFAVLDVEQDAHHDIHEAFCREVDRLLGGTCWLYGGKQMRSARPLWIARYYDETPDPAGEPDLPHVLWQFTSKGRWPGIAGNVDINVHRGDLASLARWTIQPEDDVALSDADKAWIEQGRKDDRDWVLKQLLRLAQWNSGETNTVFTATSVGAAPPTWGQVTVSPSGTFTVTVSPTT